jgi:hypothetical protein
MFATHPSFKHPVQLDCELTTWRAVEIEHRMPWLIATVLDRDEKIQRDFLIATIDDLMGLISDESVEALKALQLVRSPAWSPNSSWSAMSIARLEIIKSVRNSCTQIVTLTGHDGTIYGGSPIKPVSAGTNAFQDIQVIDLE